MTIIEFLRNYYEKVLSFTAYNPLIRSQNNAEASVDRWFSTMEIKKAFLRLYGAATGLYLHFFSYLIHL